jgi:hypothetical protein
MPSFVFGTGCFGIEFGKLFIDCAVETKLNRCIITSWVDVKKLSGGSINLPSFFKYTELEEYTNLLRDSNTSFMFKYFGFNMAYLIPGMRLVVRNGTLLNEPALPINEDTMVSFMAPIAYGTYVVHDFRCSITDWLQISSSRQTADTVRFTLPKFIARIAKTLGLRSRYMKNSYEEYYQLTKNMEHVQLYKWLNEYGLFGEKVSCYGTGRSLISDFDWRAALGLTPNDN